MKRILILSLSVGNGHVRSGSALSQYINHHANNMHAEHIDIASFLNNYALFLHKNIYKHVSKNWKWLWGFLYKMCDSRYLSIAADKSIPLHTAWAARLRTYIREHKPDIIICSYYGAPLFIKELCSELDIPIYVVMTDFHAHHIYDMEYISKFFVPSIEQKKELITFGIKENNIEVTGIPIHSGFYKKYDLTKLRKNYQIPKGKNVILLIASNYTKKLLQTILSELNKIRNIQIIVVGQKIPKSQTQNNIKNIPWTTKIHEYIALADIVISKSGGITISECMALHTPMIIVDPIPGQEEANAHYIETNKAGTLCKDIKKIETLITEFLSSKPLTKNHQASASQQILSSLQDL